MVKVNEDVNGNPLPCELYFDGYEMNNLITLNKKRNLDWDVIGGVVGNEGDGKTIKAVQTCLFMDHKFRIDNIVFTAEQFLAAVNDKDKFPNGSAILWDESDALGDHWASETTQTMTKVFKRIRKRNLFVLLVSPTFFDYNKYFAIMRMRFLYSVYADGLTRGFFKFYGPRLKKLLYINGKKNWDMKVVKPNFIGRFSKLPAGFPVDFSPDGDYDKKKDEATASLGEKVLTPTQAVKDYRKKVIEGYNMMLSHLNISLTQSQHAEALGVDQKTVSRDLRALKEGIS